MSPRAQAVRTDKAKEETPMGECPTRGKVDFDTSEGYGFRPLSG